MGSNRKSIDRKSTVLSRIFGASGMALVTLGVWSPAFADYDNALKAYATESNGEVDRAKVAEALDLWRKNAVAGDVLSREVLGDIYSNQPLFTESDEVFDAPLPADTGIIEENKVRALAWYTIAATHDFDGYSQTPTFREVNARIHAQERIPQLKATMTTEQVKAAQQEVVNILSSQSEFDLYRLGTMYQSGFGLPKNNVEALKYYRLATNRALNSNQNAARAAGFLVSIMTREEVDEADKRADEWEPPLPEALTTPSPKTLELENKLRLLGERQAATALANLEQEFKGNEHVIQNSLAALGLYLGPVDGQIGPGTRTAIKRFQYTLVENDPNLSLEEKKDVATGTLTVAQKLELIDRAAKANHPQSQYIRGIMSAEGIGYAVNGQEAIRWLKKSASYGYPLAHYALGTYYRDGIFGDDPVEPSTAEASYHFAQAAALGYKDAQKELVKLNYEFDYVQD